jgi:outer membrane cobalamin receptor
MKKGFVLWVTAGLAAGVVFSAPAAGGAEVELGRVVVTATKTETEISEVPQSISVITKEEIQNSPDRTLGEILQRAPAVQVTQNGPMGALAVPQVRGSTAGQVLILLNGQRLNDAQNGQFDLNNLPVPKEDIERIEVLRGGASALYGADALAGVINIITRTPTAKPFTSASASYGRFDTQQYSLTHRWKPGPFSYGISLGREKSDGYRENSQYDAWILGGEVGYSLTSQSEVKFSARYIQKEVGLPGPVSFPDPDDRQKDDNTLLNLSYQGQITPQLKLGFRGWHNQYRNTFDAGSQGILSMGTSALHKSSESGGDLQSTYQLGKSHLFVGGLEAIEDRANSSSFGVKEATRGAVYLQDEIEVGKPLTATLGLRYDFHSVYNDQLDPRVGVLLRLPADFRLRASAGRSFRAPTFNDLYWPASAYTAGNPNLKPETAWNYELGAEKSFQNLAAIKIAGFYRDVKDLINWAPDANFVWRPSNISDAKIWGTEAEFVLYPAKGWAIPLNYSYVYPRDESTGDPIPNRPKHMVNAGIDYKSPFGIKGSLKGRYIRLYTSQGSTLNQDYFVLDGRVGYEFKVWQYLSGEAYLSLTNALDKEYQTVEGYPMPPRSLNGGVSIAF